MIKKLKLFLTKHKQCDYGFAFSLSYYFAINLMECFKGEETREEKYFKFAQLEWNYCEGKGIKIYVETFERERGGKQVVIATKQ